MELAAIQNKIYEIRGRKVMIDFDLAELYGTETAQLKRAVKRNIERFEGDDFMFELTNDEYNTLKINSRCQIGISNEKTSRGGVRYAPFAFTELGVAMLSSVLNSNQAIKTNRDIMRAFIAVRQLLTLPVGEVKIQGLINEINEILQRQDKMDIFVYEEFGKIYEIINQFFEQKKLQESRRRPIGF